MEGERWSPDGDQLSSTVEKGGQLSKGGTLEKGSQRKAKKNLGLDFMLRKIEKDERGVEKASLVLTAEPEKASQIQREASEMEAKALGSGGSGEEVEERKRVDEEVMKEREDGNEMLADERAAAHSGSRLPAEKKVRSMKKNLSLGFMLEKPSKGVKAVEAINEPVLESQTKPDLGETATGDILAETVSNSSLKLLAADRKVQGVKRNLGLGFMAKKPLKGGTNIAEITGTEQAGNSNQKIEDLALVPASQAIKPTTNEDQMRVVGETLESEFEMTGGGDFKNGENFAALVDEQVDKKSKQTFKRFLSIPKVKTGNSGEEQQVWKLFSSFF